jgi:DNA polymerase elongation subunit (family B)
MYQNISYERETNLIHLWDDKLGYSKFPYSHYGYKADPNGEFTTIFGQKVKKVTEWSYEEQNDGSIFETDLNPEMRTLIDKYYESEEPSKGQKLMIFDIEVKSEDGFPLPDTANQEMTAIAYYYEPDEHYCVIINDPLNKIKRSFIGKIEIIPVKNEAQLINTFMNHYENYSPNLLSGWNSDWFDITYLYNRAYKICGKLVADKLSPIGIVNWSKMTRSYTIFGVSCLDYMKLYKNFTQNEQPMYSLDYICNFELGHGKTKYDGSLDELYESNLDKFIEYNLNDVQLIVELNKKLKFIELAIGVAHKGHIPYEDVYMSSRYIDGTMLTYMKAHGNIIAPNRTKWEKLEFQKAPEIGDTRLYMSAEIQNKIPRSGTLRVKRSKSSYDDVEYVNFTENYFELKKPVDKKLFRSSEIIFHFDGAFVKEPIPGLYKWLYDVDLTSMYPFNIMNLNISPETKMGKILDYNRMMLQKHNDFVFNVYMHDEIYEMTSEQIKQMINDNKYSLASNGVFYRTDIEGIIPKILRIWFAERTEYKNLMKKYGKENNIELYEFYHVRQWVTKIMLNSFYGVLGLNSFRFYDLDNADAVTSTGRSVLMFSQQMANYYYNKEIGAEYKIELEDGTVKNCFGNTIIKIKRNEIELDVYVKDLQENDDIISF